MHKDPVKAVKAGRCPVLSSRASPCSPCVTSVQGRNRQAGAGPSSATGPWGHRERVPSGAASVKDVETLEEGDLVVMVAHRSTDDGVAPSLIHDVHSCRAPPQSTPAGATRARAHHRGFPLPHNPSSIPRTRTLPQGHGDLQNVGRMPAITRAAALLPHSFQVPITLPGTLRVCE